MKQIFEITDKEIINQVLDNAEYGTLALCHNNQPYSLPINFVRVENILYFHGSLKGKKIDILKLGVTGNINHEIIPEEEKEKALAIMKEFSESIIKQLDIKATQFSDCLVFSVPVENEMACFTIFEAIAKLMSKLHAEYNLLLRGGVSIGKICHEEGGPLFGPALVEAYEIESKQAVYPRVLLSKDVAKGVLRTQMHKFILSLFEKEEYDLYISLATAYYYLIHESTVFNKEQLRKNFFLSKKAIYEQIDLVEVEKVKKKYQWLYLKMEKMESKIA